jgi:sugar lactone lactonase YvrE
LRARPNPGMIPGMDVPRTLLDGLRFPERVASPVSAEVLRVREGGEVTDRISVQTQAFACMLGGPERRPLFVCTAVDSDPATTASRSGRSESVEVAVPGASLP